MASMARTSRAVLLITAVALIQCSNVIVAARLLQGDGGWLRQGAGPLIMQVLKGGSPPGSGNNCKTDPNNPGSGSCTP